MARYALGATATGVGSTTLPTMALHGSATNGFHVREIGIWNTTAVSCIYKLVRLTTAGTPGATVTATTGYDPNQPVPGSVLAQAYTGTAPTTSDLGYRAVLGAAVGSGVIWTFGDVGITVPLGTANGLGVILESGTGQILDIYYVWDE